MKVQHNTSVFDAYRWTGPDLEEVPEWAAEALKNRQMWVENPDSPRVALLISTTMGTMRAERGDWILRNAQGSIYACRPDIFQLTYERLDGQDTNLAA